MTDTKNPTTRRPARYWASDVAARSLLTLFCAGAISTCSHTPEEIQKHIEDRAPSDVIGYYSLDRSRASIFAESTASLESPWLLRDIAPASATHYFEPATGVQCISVGPEEHAVEFAVKRPMKEGEEYVCRRYAFRVEKCFNSCSSAEVSIRRIADGVAAVGRLSSRILINECIGVVAFDLNNASGEANVFGSPTLIGEKGILASTDFPNCIAD